MLAPCITLRSSGLTELTDDTVIRFGSGQAHDMIKAALASAWLYDQVLDALGLQPQGVLVASCFAVADGWDVTRLAAPTGYTTYRWAPASALTSMGYELWPTDVVDATGVPDERNRVHFDLVIRRGLTRDELAGAIGAPAERRSVRARFLADVEPILAVMHGPDPIPKQGPER